MPRASTTSHSVLGLLGLRPSWTATELTEQISRNMRFFWPRAASRVFAESKGSVERGWVRTSTERRSGRGAQTRTRYRITAAGRRELRRWLATPPRATVLESESLLRVLLADLGSVDDLRRALQRMAADADEIFATGRVIADEYLSGTAPFQDDVHVRALVFDFLVGYAAHAADWSRRASAHVDAWQHQDAAARADAGVALVRERARLLPADSESMRGVDPSS